MSIKKIIVILFVILLGFYLLSLYIPLIIVGPPGPLFYISNEDTISHDVRVEIFDENNVSVFNNTYLLDANNSTRFEREVSWNFPFPSKLVTWDDGMYTFNFTVDNNVANEITSDIDQYMAVSVNIKPIGSEVVIDIGIWTA